MEPKCHGQCFRVFAEMAGSGAGTSLHISYLRRFQLVHSSTVDFEYKLGPFVVDGGNVEREMVCNTRYPLFSVGRITEYLEAATGRDKPRVARSRRSANNALTLLA